MVCLWDELQRGQILTPKRRYRITVEDLSDRKPREIATKMYVEGSPESILGQIVRLFERVLAR